MFKKKFKKKITHILAILGLSLVKDKNPKNCNLLEGSQIICKILLMFCIKKSINYKKKKWEFKKKKWNQMKIGIINCTIINRKNKNKMKIL